MYLESSRRELLIRICVYVWVQSEGGGLEGGQSFLAPPSKSLLGHSYEISNISSESSAQAQSIGTLLEQIGLWGGGLWTCPKVRGTRARVHAAGRVKPMKQQFTPN